jgi:hypothetical protein
MTNDPVDTQESFIIPSRTLRGSKREMVEDIDQAIVGLLALRHLIDGGAPPPEAPEFGGSQRARPHKSAWPRLFAVLSRARAAQPNRLMVKASGRRDQWSRSEVL